MKIYYPAIVEKDEDGRFTATFLDLPEAITCGDTLEQAIQMAKECLGLCLDVRKDEKEAYPEVSDPSTLTYPRGSFVMMIEYDSIEYNKRYNKKAIRKNVTIPAWLAELAEEQNVNFSNVLQNALMKKLDL